MMKHAANHTAWAIGRMQRNGFHVRRVVWGLLMAQSERRSDEEIRAASIMVEATFKRRRRIVWPTNLHTAMVNDTTVGQSPPRDLTVVRVDKDGLAYNAAGEAIGITGTVGER